jgi:hypothetical protein
MNTDFSIYDFAIYSYGWKVAEVKDDKVYFFRDSLEEKMHVFGVPIPARLRENFNNQQFVNFDEPLFARAFIQIYFPYYLHRQGCTLETIEKTNSFVNSMNLLKLDEK